MATRVENKQTSSAAHHRGNDVAALFILAIAVLLFLSLATYSQTDWNLFNNSSQYTKHNWIGIVGSSVADLLFQVIGLTSYFTPVLLALIAWRIYQSKSLRPSISRALAVILFVFSISGLIYIFGGYAGMSGKFIAEYLIWLLGKIGSGILLVAVTLASFLVISNLSFAFLSENLEMALANFKIHLEEWQTKRREAKNLQTERKPEKMPVVKTGKKTTISAGDSIALNNKEKSDSKISDMVKELAITPEIITNEKVKTPVIKDAPESEEEEIIPTISAAEKSFEKPLEKVETNKDSLTELNTDIGEIPITPIQETGELDANFIEEETAKEAVEKKEKEKVFVPQEPQNFDNYVLPMSEFLVPAQARIEQKDEELLAIAQELTGKTKEFNVTGRVMHICQGPVVTTYEFKPDPGVKYSRVTGLSDDLCLALKAESIRIERIPGKAFVGIEVPNRHRETIQLREVIESKKFKDSHSLLTIALGKTIDGLNYVADLAKMPHLLIAGATGAGKSVGVNTLIVSILYKAKPDEVKFIMVDPKRLELGVYEDIPHLATPIIKDPKRAGIALKWAVSEMEKRYKDLAGWSVRNIDGFNTAVKKRNAEEHFDDDGNPWKTLPYIVIIIDELADLMMVSGKEVEESITRLAQMARAVGIHLVLATQRPSVDVITGLIKANFPSRISFRVSSKVDSRTIIDSNGAESLLGRGDMLFLPPATSQLIRVHGAFVDEKEIHKIVEHIKAQGRPEYDTTITKTDDELDDSGDLPGRKDELFWDAVRTVVTAKKASTSLLQRHLRIGYGRAAAILDAMVREGYIGEMDGSSRARPIMPKAYEDLQDIEEQENVQ
ncbi:MAG: DNA translocase FtsK 4TM domain-containing protein [Pyrinomonadaceae bacterium]